METANSYEMPHKKLLINVETYPARPSPWSPMLWKPQSCNC